jgi:hypothetical protein
MFGHSVVKTVTCCGSCLFGNLTLEDEIHYTLSLGKELWAMCMSIRIGSENVLKGNIYCTVIFSDDPSKLLQELH